MTSSLIGHDTQTGQRVELPKTSRLQGLYIIGIQGTGKSGLIENLIIQDIRQGLGVGLLDPHGDLTNAVLSRLPQEREQDVIYLDITDYRYPFGLNLFTCSDLTNPTEVERTVTQVYHVFEKLFGVSRDTPLILQYLRNCTHTLVTNPGYTMADIPLLLTDKNCRQRLLANVKSPQVRLFWQDYDAMPPSEQRVERGNILRRVEEFLQDLTLPIVGQAHSTINLRSVMDERKILLVRLDATLESVTSLIGSLMIALFLNAAYSRTNLPLEKRKQFNLYADEFQRFATEDFVTLLEEARKFGIGTTIAHQNRGQLDTQNSRLETNLKDRTRSAGNLVVFKINSKDAVDLAGEFDITPQPAWEEEVEKEWHERVEEEMIDGEEEIQTPVPSVLDYWSQQRAYPAPAIQSLIEELAIRRHTVGGARITDLNSSPYFRYMYLFNQLFSRAQEGVPLTNFFRSEQEKASWIEAIAKTIGNAYKNELATPATDEEYEFFPSALFGGAFSEFYDKREEDFYCWAYRTKHVNKLDPAMLRKGDELLWRMVETGGNPSAFSQAAAAFADLLSPLLPGFYHSRARVVVYEKYRYETDARDRSVVPGGSHYFEQRELHPLSSYSLEKLDALLPGIISRQRAFCEQCLRDLSAALTILITNPILEGSGQYRPRKHTHITYLTHPRKTIPHPQRTYQDRLNEVASELTNLPLYTAKVKIATEERTAEYIIRTLDPERGVRGTLLQERIARIRERNSKDGYIRSRQAVEEEIQRRQDRWLKLTQLPQTQAAPQVLKPEDEPPAISRREPLL